MIQPQRFHPTAAQGADNPRTVGAGRIARPPVPLADPLHFGDRACPGCGEALAARCAIDAVLRATGHQAIAVAATGCLEALSMPHADAPCPLPSLRSLYGNAAAVASGIAAAMRAKGRDEVRVIAQAGDGATADTGFGCLSGLFERNDDVLYVCYDNGTGRSHAEGPRAGGQGAGKSLPLIAMAHGIPYVATASVADLADLERKIARATALRGARYVHVLVPCPPAWGIRPEDTSRIARLAVDCGLFPLFEAEHGEVTARTTMRRAVPTADYLRPQQRFGHLFGPPPDAARLAAIQALADRNIARFGLLG